MKNAKQIKTQINKGFTLVELLVVIGILGILAAGLLATIDPLEQLRKGRDTNKKTASIEMINALTRYSATINDFPATCTSGSMSTLGTCYDSLIAQGELKSTFKNNLSNYAPLTLTKTGTGPTASFSVCFDPESKAESSRPETQYAAADGTGTCNPATSLTCFWCAK